MPRGQPWSSNDNAIICQCVNETQTTREDGIIKLNWAAAETLLLDGIKSGRFSLSRPVPTRKFKGLFTQCVYNKVQRNKTSLVQYKNSGRHATQNTDALQKKVRDKMVVGNGGEQYLPATSSRKLADDLNVSRSTVFRCLHRMQLHALMKIKTTRRSNCPAMAQKRVSRCNEILHYFEQNPDHLNWTIFSDETYIYAREDLGQLHFYAGKGDQIPDEVRMVEIDERLKIHVWVSFCAQLGMFNPVFFLDEDTNKDIKVVQKSYMDYCINPLLQQIEDAGFTAKDFVLQQDGAPCHQAHAMLAQLRDIFKKVIGDNRGTEPETVAWPAQTPHVAPCDYSVNFALHVTVSNFCAGQFPTNKDELKELISEAFKLISKEYIASVVSSFLPRLRAVVANEGIVHTQMAKRKHVPYVTEEANMSNSNDTSAPDEGDDTSEFEYDPAEQNLYEIVKVVYV